MTEILSLDTGAINLPFTAVDMTRAINELPTPFGQMTSEGYFPAEPLASSNVEITIENDVLTALPQTGDGPPTMSKQGTAKSLIFKVPTISHLDNFWAKDIRNMLAIIGRSKKPETAADLMNKRLMRFKNKFNLTWELMRMSCAKGKIVDGAGNEIYDLYAAFELTKKVVYFDLDNAASDVSESCDLLWALMTQDLADEVMSGITVKCSRSFFSKLIKHGSVKQYWQQSENALQMMNLARGTDGGYRPRGFTIGNVRFEEYAVAVPMWGGTNTLIIAATKGHAFPTGTLDTHVTYVAPPNDLRSLDGGLADVTDAIHITTEPMKHGKGLEILGEMNALPLWRRPNLLVECDAGAGTSTVPRGEA